MRSIKLFLAFFLIASVAFGASVRTGGGGSSGASAGVSSVSKSGSAQLTGDVTLSQGANVTLTQIGNDIAIASSGTGGLSQWLTTNVGIGTWDNVGIGTVTPIATLNISSTANQDLFRIDDNATNDLSPFIVNKDGNVGIGTNNTETAKLLVMGGNVGLGTWIPDQALDVKGTVIISGNLGVGTLQTNSTLTVASTLAQDMFRVDDNGAGDPSPFIIDQGGNVGIGTTTPGGALTITSGNVGIGTWLPVAGLDIVNGVAGLRISGSGADSAVMTSGGNWGIGSINPTQTLDVAGNSTFSMNVGIGTNRVTTSALTIMNGNVGIGTWVVDGGAFIVKTGNIGISTIRPGQTLDIQGTGIRAIDYYSGDGTQGATLTCGGVSVTQIIIKDGLITSCTGT